MPNPAAKEHARARGMKVPDDRGRVVRAAYVGAPTADMKADGRAHLGNLAWQAALGKSRRTLVIALLLTAVAVVVPLVVLPLSEPERGIILFGAGAPAFVAIMWLARRAAAPRFVRELAARGVCGSCFYPLDGLHPASDECTVCPECGAAWRLPPTQLTTGITPAE